MYVRHISWSIDEIDRLVSGSFGAKYAGEWGYAVHL